MDYIERNITEAAIKDRDFIIKIKPYFRGSYFDSPAKYVVRWCIDFYDKYDKAPQKDILLIWEKFRDSGNPDIEVLEEFFDSIDWESGVNSDVIFDEAIVYFKKKSLLFLSRNIELALGNGDVEEAEKILSNYKTVEKIDNTYIDPFGEEGVNEAKTALEKLGEPILRYPDPLGKMFNEHFTRDSFVALLAPEKRGKTWWLIEFAIRALRQRLKVAFFEVGDMTSKQVLRRIYSMITGKTYIRRYVGSGRIPVLDCVKNQDDTCNMKERENNVGLPPGMDHAEAREMGYNPCSYCKRHNLKDFEPTIFYDPVEIEMMTEEDIEREARKFRERYGSNFRLSVHSANSISASGIDAILDEWKEQDNFIPDVVIIDYADLLAPEVNREYRHQVNDTWINLRRISQDWHCLLITATQADADSYKRTLLGKSNFSEDKRKLAHVTAMFGLNQEDNEKRMGVMRINQIVIREGFFTTTDVVKVLQALHVGKVFITSY